MHLLTRFPLQDYLLLFLPQLPQSVFFGWKGSIIVLLGTWIQNAEALFAELTAKEFSLDASESYYILKKVAVTDKINPKEFWQGDKKTANYSLSSIST